MRIRHAQVRILQRFIQPRRQPLPALEDIDEPRAGNSDLGDGFMLWNGSDDLFRQITGLHARGLGQGHGQVAGEVAMGLVPRNLDLDGRDDVGGQHALVLEAGNGACEQLADKVLHMRSVSGICLWKAGHYPRSTGDCQICVGAAGPAAG